MQINREEKAVNKELPLVTIIIPVYNGSEYLNKAIDSAINQTYRNLEIIVVNDGSNDGGKTKSIASSYGDRIRLINKENGGVSTALNTGIREMQGQYFSWLSHDDEYYPTKIEEQIKTILKQQKEKTIALCGTEFINPDGIVLKKKWKMPKSGLYDAKQAIDYQLKDAFSGIAFLIPRYALLECGAFDESLRYTQDADMWHRLFLAGYSLAVDTKPLTRSRLHGGQQTNLHRERFVEEINKTTSAFVNSLYDRQYYDLIRSEWIHLLKNNISEAADFTKQFLISTHLMDNRTRAMGRIYMCYGRIRPFLRTIYYKLKYDISSVGDH